MIDDTQWARIHASLAAFGVDADKVEVDEYWWLADPVTFLPPRFIEPLDWTSKRERWPLRHGLDKLTRDFAHDQERPTPLQEAAQLDKTLATIETLIARFNTDGLGVVHFSDETEKAEQALEALADKICIERDGLVAAGPQSHLNAKDPARRAHLEVLAQLFAGLTAGEKTKQRDLVQFLAACLAASLSDSAIRNFVYRDR